MKLIIKQKILSWFGTYYAYDEQDNIVYTIRGELSWGHKLRIYDNSGKEVAMLDEEILHLLARFNIIINNENVGQIQQKLSWFKHKYIITKKDWVVRGNGWSTKFVTTDKDGNELAYINRKIFKLQDTYEIDITDPTNAIYALLIAITVDIMAEKSAAVAASV